MTSPEPVERPERVISQALADQGGDITDPTLDLLLDQGIAEPEIDGPALHAQRVGDRLG